MRFIDADALIEAMTKFSNATGEDMTHGIFYAHIAPTIDAVPVIRCRECKWWKFNGREYYCDEKDAMVKPCENDFCSLADRKPPQVNPEMVKALRDRIEKQGGEHDTAD